MNKLTRYKKNKITKTHKIIISFILIILTIGIGYSALVTNLSISGNITVKEYVRPRTKTFPSQIENLMDTEECMYRYEGAVTDELNNTVSEASNVYYNRCADKRNIKFANICWQMIRTTETGGIKMIYNGEPDGEGKCLSTRNDHKGIVQSSYRSQNIASSYLYGSSFTYNTTTSEFILVNTSTATWSDSTYQNLIGKYTCMSASNICTTLYEVNSYASNTNAYVSYYTIADTNYAQIGTSSYNTNSGSPAMVGYKFNKVYNYNSKTGASINGTYKFGSTFTYDTGTNKYTISGITQDISDWSSGYNNINNTHYTCWNDTGICETISYVNYTYSSSGNQGAYYFNIKDGKNVNDILNEMLWDNDVNTYNSSIKGIIDSWYAQNLSTKTNMLEDTVFCNARNTTSLGSWNPDGGNTTSDYYIKFKNYTSSNDISCSNLTDQFTASNNIAKLTYPVGLATQEELYTLTNNNSSAYYSTLTNTGTDWWAFSAVVLYKVDAHVCEVDSYGKVDVDSSVSFVHGARPVITLSTATVISEGNGSASNPFIIQEN